MRRAYVDQAAVSYSFYVVGASAAFIAAALSLSETEAGLHSSAMAVGMIVAGVGIGNTIPQIFNAAGRIPPAGPSLSAVFTTLTLAFVAGPPLIGGVSDAIGISGAFWLFVVASVAVALMVPRVPSAETNPRFRHES